MTATGEWHNINKLYGSVTGGSGGQAKSLHTSLGRGRYGLINNIVVYDLWYTTLSAPDSFWIGGAGGDVLDYVYVESYGKDWFDTKHEMAYTLSRYNIPENLDNYEKTWPITVTQIDTGIQITIICTQGPVEWTTEYALSMSLTTLPASGGYTYSTVYIYTYRNGKYYSYTTTNTTSMDGYSADGNNHVLDDTWLYVRSAGTNYYSYTKNVYVITSYTFNYNGVLYEEDAYLYIYQKPNTREYTTVYNVTMGVASVPSIGAEGGTFTVDALCQTAGGYKYESGASEITGSWTEAPAYVYGDNCSINPSAFTGESTITATVDENDSTVKRAITVRARSANDMTAFAERTIYQDASTYYLTDINRSTSTKELTAAYNQSTITCSVFSILNTSTPVAITSSDVSISTAIDNVKIDKIVISEIPAYQYNVVISIGTNATKVDRTATVTITKNGKTMTFNVTQKAEASSAPSGLSVWASDGDWHLGTVATGANTGSPNYIPAYMLIVCKATEINTDATATYNFTYVTTTPATNGGTQTTEYSKAGSQSILAGSEITINGVKYYGTQILSGTGLGCVTVSSFEVN